MNLKNLSDEKLLSNFRRITGDERAMVVTTLYYFREVEARRLFSEHKFESLREFGMKFLKYSGDEADRRIAAMRLMREVPGIEKKLLDGSLNMTNFILIRVLFRKEKKAGKKYSPEQKWEIIKKFENVSTRKARKVAAEINPEMAKRELSFEDIQDDGLREKLIRLKAQRSHKNPHLTLNELLHELADLALQPKNPPGPRKAHDAPAAPRAESTAETLRQIERRDHSKCTNCGSIFLTQKDHIQPRAARGETTYENMRLLCRNCNLRAAIKFYGRKKMASYLSDVRRPYGASQSHLTLAHNGRAP